MAEGWVPEGDAWSRALGIEVLEVEAGPHHHQPYGVLHGGVIVETVASYGAGNLALSLGKGVLGVSNATESFRSHGRDAIPAERGRG